MRHRHETEEALGHPSGEQDGEEGQKPEDALHDPQRVQDDQLRYRQQPVDEGTPPGDRVGRIEVELEREAGRGVRGSRHDTRLFPLPFRNPGSWPRQNGGRRRAQRFGRVLARFGHPACSAPDQGFTKGSHGCATMPGVTLFDPVPLFGDEPEERPAAWDLVDPAEPIDPPQHAVEAATSARPEIEVRLSTRRRKTSEAKWVGGKIVVSLPAHLSLETPAEDHRLARRTPLTRHRLQSVHGDDDLLGPRHQLSERYLVGARPESVRWVTNQTARWGSCSYYSGDIRSRTACASCRAGCSTRSWSTKWPTSPTPTIRRPSTAWPAATRATRKRGCSWPATDSGSQPRSASAPLTRPPAQTGSSARILPRRRRLSFAPPEGQLDLLGQEEVAVQRVVAVDADAAVQVRRRRGRPAGHPRRPSTWPSATSAVGRQSLGQPCRRLPRREPDGLGVDVGVGGPLAHGLEGGDGLVELHPRSWCTRPSAPGRWRRRRPPAMHSAVVANSVMQSTTAAPSAPSPSRRSAPTAHAASSTMASGRPVVVVCRVRVTPSAPGSTMKTPHRGRPVRRRQWRAPGWRRRRAPAGTQALVPRAPTTVGLRRGRGRRARCRRAG